jgi:hypothetical protein
MRTDTITYYNGKRYMRRVRTASPWCNPGSKLHTFITFAYRGVPDEWPVLISYTIR